MESLAINSIIFVVITCLLCEGGTVSLQNQYCQARPTLVALDHPTYNFFPYFVMLHRCSGSCGTSSPTVRECVATEYNEVDIHVYVHSIGQGKVIKERNHTKCGHSCVAKPEDCNPNYQRWNEGNCKCECKFNNSDPPTGSCPVDHKWNRGSCECECTKPPETCGVREKWSKDACACVPDCSKGIEAKKCKRKGRVFDTKTCSCLEKTIHHTVQVQPDTGRRPSDTNNSRTKLFTGLLVGESFVLIVLCVVLIYTRCHSRRQQESPSTDYLKSPITGSSESLNFPDGTERKSNDFATTEVKMISETDFVTRKM